MTKYKCIKKIWVAEAEEPHGEWTGNDLEIEEGSIWYLEDGDSILSNSDDSMWLSIDDEELEKYFEKVEE